MLRSSTPLKRFLMTCGLALMLISGLSVALRHVPIVQAQPAGTTFTVTNTDDSGAGSLREAIDNANTTAAMT